MILALLLAVLAILGSQPSHAADGLQATPWVDLYAGSRVRLIGVEGSVQGRTAAGVEVLLAEDWKTYWRMPGDAGVPPQFDWKGSGNVASVKVLYPAPKRLAEPAAETIGYKGGVLFPIQVEPKDPLRPVELKLALEIGICREICVPAIANLALTIPPSTQPAAVVPAGLSRALDRVPRPQSTHRVGDPELTKVVAVLDGKSPHLTIEGRFPLGEAGADVFIEAPDSIYVPMAKRVPGAAEGVIRFQVDLSQGGNARDLKGRVLTVTLVSDAGATEAPWQLP